MLVLLSAAPTRAEASGPATASRRLPTWVRLVLPECPTPPVDARLVLEVLRTELRDDGVHRVDSGRVERGQSERPQAYLRLAAPCEPQLLQATLRIEDPSSLKAVERQMEFDDLPPSARPRALALGLAELLRASWSWLAILEPPLVSVPTGIVEPPGPESPPLAGRSAPTPAEAEAPPSSPEPPAEAPPPDPGKLLAALSPSSAHGPLPVEPPDRSPSLHVSGKALWFVAPGNPVWGGQAVGEYERWSLGAQLLAGSEETSSGRVALRLVTGTLGITALTLSSERFELRSGITVAVGRASVDGTPGGSGIKGAQGAAPFLGATLSTRTRWWLSRAWACTLEAEAGYASGLIATVDGREAASLAGWLGGVSLGVSFAP